MTFRALYGGIAIVSHYIIPTTQEEEKTGTLGAIVVSLRQKKKNIGGGVEKELLGVSIGGFGCVEQSCFGSFVCIFSVFFKLFLPGSMIVRCDWR